MQDVRESGARSVVAVALLVFCVSAGSAIGCSLLLETDTNPHKCQTDQDCARYTNAVCDVRHFCVPKLPEGPIPDGSANDGPPPGGMCELFFDNRGRVPSGPDGGLRPLPEAP